MKNKLYFDFETYSPVDLPSQGAYKYAYHPETVVLCLALAYKKERFLWFPRHEPQFGDPSAAAYQEPKTVFKDLPEKWRKRFANPKITKVAHNIIFDWLIYTRCTTLPFFPFEGQTSDTMEKCLMNGIPGALSKACQVLEIPEVKHPKGRAAMLEITRKGPHGIKNREEKMKWLGEYCIQDVEMMIKIDEILPDRFTETETEVRETSLHMNTLGIPLDMPSVNTLVKTIARFDQDMDKMIPKLSGGLLERDDLNSPMKFGAYLDESGFPVPNAQKKTLEDLFDSCPDKTIRDILEYRMILAQASIKKVGAMQATAWTDGRSRLTLQYYGAHTGRWAGRSIQPQNMIRDTMSDGEFKTYMRLCREYLKRPKPRKSDIAIIRHMPRALRKLIKPPTGKTFLIYDYAQIEARVLAHITQSIPLISAFVGGVDIYTEFADSIGASRQVGKTAILGLGFQMGAERFKDQVKSMAGVDLDIAESQNIVTAYRNKYPKIRSFWKTVEDAFRTVYETEKALRLVSQFPNLAFKFEWDRDIDGVTIQLPGGRKLCYPKTSASGRNMHYIGYRVGQIREVGLYGGILTENIVQALARDIMAGAISGIRDLDVEPVFTVHDEIVLEAFKDFTRDKKNVKNLEDIMTTNLVPSWMDHRLIKLEGGIAKRYGK